MPNHLINAKSLYLRKHAFNPINWWYWCEEALQTAAAEDKPIFLSIGYSSCHWCTVMEGEAFSNPEIADYLNNNFLPIKVDREERPDLDSIYMQALQMITGQGGWPLNIFLTPRDLVPFYGGTYFPIQPRYNLPGFLAVLQSLRQFYDQEKTKLEQLKGEILSGLQGSTYIPPGPTDSLTPELLYQAIETNTGVISRQDFNRPRFPMIPHADLALRGTRFGANGRYQGRELSQQWGEDLALGGIFDQVAGGFHRYTVDATWTVPHFEKMLYDNGLIVDYLANLWSCGVQEPAFPRAIALTVQWLQREMTSPQGYFYASQDADSFINPGDPEPEEGAFYIWNYTELQELLTEAELEELVQHFTISEEGNFEGQNVLQRRQGGELSDEVEAILDKLFKARYGASRAAVTRFNPAFNNQEVQNFNWPGRIPPVTDPKMIVAWNSLMISGLARAAVVFDEPHYLELAKSAINFILNQQWPEGRLHRLNYHGEAILLAQAEDYALLIKALLDLYASEPTTQFWLEKAIAVQSQFDELFWSLELGGYYNNASDDCEHLLIRERSYNDNATPAANGIATSNLIRLSLWSDDLSYLDRAQTILAAFSPILQQFPQACPSLVSGLDWYLHSQSATIKTAIFPDLVSRYYPATVWKIDSHLPSETFGIVCQGLSCREPATSLEMLLEQLQKN